jgi:hypothetical protein
MYRVETSANNPDLLTAAFTDGQRSSVIVLNRSTHAQRLHLDWQEIRWSQMERTSFYAENEEKDVPQAIVIQPGEIVTLSDFRAN